MVDLVFIDAFTIGFGVFSSNYSVGSSILYNSLVEAQIKCVVLKRPAIIPKNYSLWIELLAKRIVAFHPTIVAFSTRCDTIPLVMDLAIILKTQYDPNLHIILGGPHVSICYSAVMESSEIIDCIIVGEGEETLPNLAKAIIKNHDCSGIPGVVYKDKKNGIIYTGNVKYGNLNKSHVNQYKLILDNYVDEQSWFPIEIGRGCQYNCTFCCTTKMWRQKYRLYDAISVANTIKAIIGDYNIHSFQFIHDNILSSEKSIPFLTTLARELSDFSVRWECSARIDNVTEQKIKLLQLAKCKSVYFGFETASSKMQKIYRKNIDLSCLEEKLEILKQYNMGFVASFVIGHPEEQMDDISKTLSLAVRLKKESNCHLIQLHRLSFINGSEIYEQYKNDLVFDGDYPDRNISKLDGPIFTDISNNLIYSYFHSYSKYNPEIKRLLENADVYADIINRFSKSLSFIQEIIKEDVIIEVLDAFKNSIASNNIYSIDDWLKSKGLNDIINKIHTIMNFEDFLYYKKKQI